MKKANKSHAEDGGRQAGKWYRILELIPKQARGVALVTLVSEAVVIAVITLLPAPQRIYGFIVFAGVLIGALIATVVVNPRSASQDHNQPDFEVKVAQLKERLVDERFLPDLIVAIPSSGLGIAGMLAKKLGNHKVVPVISLTRLDEPVGFNNTFNHLSFKRQDFPEIPAKILIKILIVDDICRSGRTLADAMTFIKSSIAKEDFVIKTAAISFYLDSYSRATQPSFFVDRPKVSIRDASGDVEEM